MTQSRPVQTQVAELREVHDQLQAFLAAWNNSEIPAALSALEESAAAIGEAWSRSWLGYHSLVYYRNLQPPPPGAHFSSEWGLRETVSPGTRGNWVEYDANTVRTELFRRAGDPDLHDARGQAEVGEKNFEEKRDQLMSILTTSCSRYEDQFVARLLDDAKAAALVSAAEYIRYARPSGRMMSRDSLAASQGLWAPPHIEVVAEIVALRSPALGCETLAKIAHKAASHLERLERQQVRAERSGTNVFIGHGSSPIWKDLKDFIQDRLRLPWDEFNRVPVAGITNIARLSEMLDAAAIALLVMTAEDEQADGQLHARMNVVHEAGLFQGRLGFSKAVILLEDGCAQFSNIEGLGQIRFPKGDIKACFEDVRKVLEREDLLES